jgi:hypothetical protein
LRLGFDVIEIALMIELVAELCDSMGDRLCHGFAKC